MKHNYPFPMSPAMWRESVIARALFHTSWTDRGSLVMLTVTFAERGIKPSAAWKRLNDFIRKKLNDTLKGRYMCTLELHGDGTPHFHLLMVIDDVAKNSVFDLEKKRWRECSALHLKWFRFFVDAGQKEVDKAKSGKKAVGYFNFMPVFGDGKAGVFYIAKYVTKTLKRFNGFPEERVERENLGVKFTVKRKTRLVSFGRAWNRPTSCMVAGPVTRRKMAMQQRFCDAADISIEEIPMYAFSKYGAPMHKAIKRLWDNEISQFWSDGTEPF